MMTFDMMSIPIDICKLHPDAIVPKYQTDGASGFDLHALESIQIAPGETLLVKTGLSFAIPKGFELQVRPRSGTSLKTSLRVANSPGTIDSDYRGEVCVIISNTYHLSDDETSGNQIIRKGDRIAQGVICPVFKARFVEVEELDETQRGEGGFGSTGSKA